MTDLFNFAQMLKNADVHFSYDSWRKDETRSVVENGETMVETRLSVKGTIIIMATAHYPDEQRWYFDLEGKLDHVED